MKKLIKIAIILIIVSILLKIEKEFKRRDVFNVKEVELLKSGIMLKKEMNDLKQMLLKKNIHDIDFEKIKEIYEKDVRIEQFLIKKEGIDKIKIRVIEKKAKYYGVHKEKIYILDEDGEIIATLDEVIRDSLPIICFNNSNEKKEILAVINNFLELDYSEDISQVYKKKKDTIYVILRDGTIIITNEKVKKEKYNLAINLYNDLIKDKKIKYMDIRFRDIVVKEKEE